MVLKILRLGYKIKPAPIKQSDVWQLYAGLKSQCPSVNFIDFKVKRNIYYGEETFLNQMELSILTDHVNYNQVNEELKQQLDINDFQLSLYIPEKSEKQDGK